MYLAPPKAVDDRLVKLEESRHYEESYRLCDKALLKRVLNSCAIERIMIFLEQEEAIKMQSLNRFMYSKSEHVNPIVMGHKTEPCIILYSNYKNKSGAVSVIIG